MWDWTKQFAATFFNAKPFSPLASKSYNNLLKDISLNSVAEAHACLRKAGENLKNHLVNTNPEYHDTDLTDCFSVAVTVDGTWQKRYSFNSLLGVVFIIAVDTGEVLDYEVKVKHCFECRARNNWNKESERYIKWYQTHEANCSINHTKSAEAMEKDSVVDIFARSIELHNLKYTTYVGNGESSSFAVVHDAMFEKYGEEHIITKEDCVGHIQKRMGTNLRNYKKGKKGEKLADGFTVGGRGRLT